jgi:hypothetical protein
VQFKPNITNAMGLNIDVGKRSEVPFSRREEGREMGEENRKRKVREKEGAALANLFVMSFSLLDRVVKMESCMEAGLYFWGMKWKFSKRREVISHLSQQKLLSKTWKQKAEWKLRLG